MPNIQRPLNGHHPRKLHQRLQSLGIQKPLRLLPQSFIYQALIQSLEMLQDPLPDQHLARLQSGYQKY